MIWESVLNLGWTLELQKSSCLVSTSQILGRAWTSEFFKAPKGIFRGGDYDEEGSLGSQPQTWGRGHGQAVGGWEAPPRHTSLVTRCS